MLRTLIDQAWLFAAKRSWTVAQRTMLSIPYNVGGQPFKVPIIAGSGLINTRIGSQSLALMHVAHHVLQHARGGIVDVGCNVGHFLQLCLLADRQRPYVGFDISLSCCHYVERFIHDNALPAHSVLPIGLSDRAGIEHFMTDGPFDVCASLSQDSHQAGRFAQRRSVVTERGDDVLAWLGMDEISLIKIDVEGAEPQVLAGLSETVARARPFLLFEVLSYAHLSQLEGDPNDLRRVAAQRRDNALAMERYFVERDYVIYRLCDNGRLELRETVDPGGFIEDTSADHLALPRERADEFLRDYRHGVERTPPASRAA